MHSSTKKPILVTGTVAYDHLMNYPQGIRDDIKQAISHDVLSVSFEPNRYERRYGGTGANIAWNVALLGGAPLLVANVGTDGLEYVQLLNGRGIDTRYVQEKKTVNTATGVCLSDPKGHQIWFFYRGADTVGHWPTIDSSDTPAYAIIGARYHLQMLEALEWCTTQRIPSLFDPGQEILRFTPEELRYASSKTTGLIMNEFEWSVFSDRVGMSASDVITHAEYLIVTKGEDGYTIFTKEGQQDYPRCNCDNPINPTGTGDAFRAGLVHGLTSNWTLEQSSKLGAAIASFVVEQEGSLLPELNRDFVQQRVRMAYNEELPALRL